MEGELLGMEPPEVAPPKTAAPHPAHWLSICAIVLQEAQRLEGSLIIGKLLLDDNMTASLRGEALIERMCV
jgi:hypothetical protein